MNFSIKDFFSKCYQIRRKMKIWSHLMNKSLMENFIFCAVSNLCCMLYFISAYLLAKKKINLSIFGRLCQNVN